MKPLRLYYPQLLFPSSKYNTHGNKYIEYTMYYMLFQVSDDAQVQETVKAHILLCNFLNNDNYLSKENYVLNFGYLAIDARSPSDVLT